MKLESYHNFIQIVIWTADRIVPVSFGQCILISHSKIEDAQIWTSMDAWNKAAIR